MSPLHRRGCRTPSLRFQGLGPAPGPRSPQPYLHTLLGPPLSLGPGATRAGRPLPAAFNAVWVAACHV